MAFSNRSPGITLRHATVIDGVRILADQAVTVLGDRIEAIIPDQEYSDDRENFDVGHAFVAPGFIDLQLNGTGGVLFNDAISHCATTQRYFPKSSDLGGHPKPADGSHLKTGQ